MKLQITAIKKETEKAILISTFEDDTMNKEIEIWLPKSQIDFYHTYGGGRDSLDSIHHSEVMAIDISTWIAKQKGLIN